MPKQIVLCRSRAWLIAGMLVAGYLLGGKPAVANEAFAPSGAITLPNSQMVTSFDIGTVDPAIGVYALADRTNAAVDIIDTGTNTVISQLKSSFQGAQSSNDISGPNGALIVNHRELWAGDGNSTIKVIDLRSQQTTHVINTGGLKRADELCYDPRDHLIMMANDAETPYPFVTLISTDTYKVVETITMNGTNGTSKATNGIEQCQWSRRTGMFYLNLPEVNGPGDDSQPGAVLVISPQTMAVTRTFNIPLGVCAGPQGMAIGPENQILLGCNDPSGTVPSTVVINEHSGAVMRVLPNEDGSDEVWFNDGDDHYFLARSGGSNPQQLGVVDAQTGKEDASYMTGLPKHSGNHSVAADPIMNQVYVPISSGSGSTICGSLGGSDAQGCIAVFTTTNDDRIARNQRH
jgi:hypothetical protein